MESREGGRWLCDDIPRGRGGGGGVSHPDQYWNSIPGPGGGEAQLMASRDVVQPMPMVQPMSQPVLVRPEAVGVSAVSVDATLRQRDRILSTNLDSVMVVTEGLQPDDWTRLRSDLPRREGSAVGVESDVDFVEGPASVFQSGVDGCARTLLGGGGGGLPLW